MLNNGMEPQAKKVVSRGRIVRILVYGSLCVLTAFGIIEKCIHIHLASEYRKGKEELEMNIQKDERFNNVRVFFSSTRPSVFVLAPKNLPLDVREDLERLTIAAFNPLQVPVYYKGDISSVNTNQSSDGVNRQTPIK